MRGSVRQIQGGYFDERCGRWKKTVVLELILVRAAGVLSIAVAVLPTFFVALPIAVEVPSIAIVVVHFSWPAVGYDAAVRRTFAASA